MTSSRAAILRDFVPDGWVADVLADIRRDVCLGLIPVDLASLADLPTADRYLAEIPDGPGRHTDLLRQTVAAKVNSEIRDGILADLA